MTRADILAYLQAQFAALATETGQGTADDADGYKPAIDAALRALGVSAADLATAEVSDADTPDYLALAEYYALLRFQRALAVRVDVAADAPAISKRRSQAFAAVTKLIEQAKADLKARGYLGGNWSMGSINLDFIESSSS